MIQPTYELSFSAVGEEVLILKAIVDAYRKVQEHPDADIVRDYMTDRVARFEMLWREASFRMEMEAFEDGARLAPGGLA